ncbi:hypothetical protein [Arthrobacter sp. NA-172]|uniref:hypothetical protein n=1 Tax=Arthrobacter sp. NA-172 TaxID=3367524 RepID=UPI0037546B23
MSLGPVLGFEHRREGRQGRDRVFDCNLVSLGQLFQGFPKPSIVRGLPSRQYARPCLGQAEVHSPAVTRAGGSFRESRGHHLLDKAADCVGCKALTGRKLADPQAGFIGQPLKDLYLGHGK